MTTRAAFVYDDVLSRHVLSKTHPMKPVRLQYTFELLESYNAFEASNALLVAPRSVTEDEVLRYHTGEYLEAVKAIDRGDDSVNLARFSFGPGDNPAYQGIHEAARLSAGASMKGVDLLLSHEVGVAFNISGGLHHAMPDRASGFCVFNDPVVAIKELLRHGLKVAYVDIDCHHGDGVQHAFYDTDAVLTISIHESGAFLFPGTGFPQETGTGQGRGYTVNVPLYPYTGDDVFFWVFREVVSPLLEAFKPDVLVTQLGIDTHYRDPITHLTLTVQGFGKVVQEFRGMAPKWLALGGGGYDLQAVARAWTVAFGVMSGQEFSDEIPPSYRERFHVDTLSDTEHLTAIEAAQEDARRFAEESVKEVRRLVFPIHGLRNP